MHLACATTVLPSTARKSSRAPSLVKWIVYPDLTGTGINNNNNNNNNSSSNKNNSDNNNGGCSLDLTVTMFSPFFQTGGSTA